MKDEDRSKQFKIHSNKISQNEISQVISLDNASYFLSFDSFCDSEYLVVEELFNIHSS